MRGWKKYVSPVTAFVLLQKDWCERVQDADVNPSPFWLTERVWERWVFLGTDVANRTGSFSLAPLSAWEQLMSGFMGLILGPRVVLWSRVSWNTHFVIKTHGLEQKIPLLACPGNPRLCSA